MEPFILSDMQKKALYKTVETLTPHSDLYFTYHIEPVARNCHMYAQRYFDGNKKIDPTVCEIAGLLHDIGYTREYESNEQDHIRRGVVIAEALLSEHNIPPVYRERIVDCIWTHDGNLERSRFRNGNRIPLENVFVNDIDALCFFDWPLDKLVEFVQQHLKVEDYKTSLLREADKTLSYVQFPYFKFLANEDYRYFKEKLGHYGNQSESS